MLGFRRVVDALIIPLHIATFLWLAFGRGFFGCTVAWFAVLLVFTLPFTGGALVLTSVLAMRRRATPPEPRLSPTQAVLHVVFWLAVVVAGLGIQDVSDNEVPSDVSIITKVLGGDVDHPRAEWVFPVAFLAIIVTWAAMVIVGIAEWSRRPAQVRHPISAPPWPPPAPR